MTDYKKLVEQNKDYLKRAKFARTIIENKETLKSPIMGMKLDWKVLYRDAENAHRHWLANEIMEGTKGDLRLAWQYQKVNRECGKAYAQVKRFKEKDKVAPEQNEEKLARLTAKRDRTAQHLINVNKNLIKFVLPGKEEKIEAQASKHRQRVERAALYKYSQDNYHAIVKEGIKQDSLQNVDKFIESQEEIKRYLKVFDKRFALYGQAFKKMGISEQQINADKALLKAQALLSSKVITKSSELEIQALKNEIKGLLNDTFEKKAKLEKTQLEQLSKQIIKDNKLDNSEKGSNSQSNQAKHASQDKFNEQNKINRHVAKEISNEQSSLSQINKRMIEQARLSDIKMPKQQPTHIKQIPGKSLGEHQL